MRNAPARMQKMLRHSSSDRNGVCKHDTQHAPDTVILQPKVGFSVTSMTTADDTGHNRNMHVSSCNSLQPIMEKMRVEVKNTFQKVTGS